MPKPMTGADAGLFRYELEGGWTVLAGRTDRDNDRLSLEIARPNDWWFHVRGMPGSHVVLRAREDQEPDRIVLKRAAAIAAWHSKAREAGVVAVSCTRARYVSKPRGAEAGTVQVRKETVFKVRPGVEQARGPASGIRDPGLEVRGDQGSGVRDQRRRVGDSSRGES